MRISPPTVTVRKDSTTSVVATEQRVAGELKRGIAVAFLDRSRNNPASHKSGQRQLDSRSIDRFLKTRTRSKVQMRQLIGDSHDLLENPTHELIAQRFKGGSRPGKRTDNFKLGLAIEGGGMRGIISGSMLMELRRLGLNNVFDAVYGASAGAINATYYLADQDNGIHIYTEDLTTTFVNTEGFKQGRPVMDMDYLFDHVMHKVKPLDVDALLSSPVPLKVVASNLDTLQPVVLDNFTSREDLFESLRASANVPHLVGPPRVVRGQRLVDAAVFEPVPVESALRDGCTHVLVLGTRSTHLETGTWKDYVSRHVTKAVLHAWLSSPAYQPHPEFSFFDTSSQLDNQSVMDDLLGSSLDVCPHEVHGVVGGYVLPIFPATTHGLHPLCTELELLEKGVQEGAAAIQRAFASFLPASCMPPTKQISDRSPNGSLRMAL